eukprot:14332305-Alexandrium_andersonii.AAC.1
MCIRDSPLPFESDGIRCPAGFVAKATFLELEGEDCGCEWETMSCPASFDDGSFEAPAAQMEPA